MFHWASFLTYAVVTAVTPGPNNIMAMSNAAKNGFKKALPFNIGIFMGFSVVMVLCAVFCSVLTAFIPRIKMPMLVIGAGYMLYLAWHTWRDDGKFTEKYAQQSMASGLLLQFVNPKIYIYGIMSMQAYILPFYADNYFYLFLFAMLLAAIGAFFSFCWALFGSLFEKLFLAHGKVINTIMALLLVYCAVSLFL